jgi:hypothetical protein
MMAKRPAGPAERLIFASSSEKARQQRCPNEVGHEGLERRNSVELKSGQFGTDSSPLAGA